MKREWLLGLLVAAIAFAVFSPALTADFVEWDDDINIYRNPHIRGLGAHHLAWMFSDLSQAMRYKPLSWLTWALIESVAGLRPSAFHLINLLFHAANSALLFFLILRLLRLASLDPPSSDRDRKQLLSATFAALLWAVHPLRAEPVVWATGLPYGQAVFFALTSALCYLRAWPERRPGPVNFRWLVASLTAFTLALLTYPIVLTYWLALAVLDWWWLQRFNDGHGSLRDPTARAVWFTKIPFALITAIFLALALYARWHARGIWAKPQGVDEFGLVPRVAQAFYVWAYYVWKTFLPFDLSPVYTTLVWFQPTDAPFVVSALLVIGVTGVLVWRWRRGPGALALWLAYLALLIPVLGFTEYPHIPNDRYNLFAHVVMAIAVGAMLARLWERKALRRRSAVVSAGIVVALSTLACRQAFVWKDTESLFRHVLAKLPHNRYRCDIYWRYGQWLMRTGRSEEAEQNQLAALRLAPDYANPYESLGELRAHRGQWQEAIAFHQKALELKPGLASALDSLAWLRATTPELALRNGEEALHVARRLVEGSAEPDPIFLSTYAAALAETGQFAKAIDTAESARVLAVAFGETALATVLDKMLVEFRAGRPFRLQADQGERRR